MLPLIETRIMVVLVVMVVVVVVVIGILQGAGRQVAKPETVFFEVAVAIISIFVCIVEVPVRS